MNDEGQLPSEMWLQGTNKVRIFLKVMKNTHKSHLWFGDLGRGIVSEADCSTKAIAKNE